MMQQPNEEIAPLVYGTPLTRDSWEGITERDFEIILDRLGEDAAEAWIKDVVAAAGVPAEFIPKNQTDFFHSTGFGMAMESWIENPLAKMKHDDHKNEIARDNAVAAQSHCKKILKKVRKRRRAEAEEIQRQEDERQRQAEEQRLDEERAEEARRLRAKQHLQDLTTAAAEAVRVADDMPPLDRQNLPATPRSQWTPW
ncbi:hypothetical protein [Corynebacterium terpenotabidum]|uniref:Uncharacterized protein n=1 Tax=Corynebacterium terpenotabidum Y-11 TaxID=1200352 RepID=S4XC97_9CORY|nr:hypothetical protein [Corynebacterium terpenotabidum]AGP30109.1 hypothetical protein A606_02280 [Corynebacterium terpenotabidum Y-11]